MQFIKKDIYKKIESTDIFKYLKDLRKSMGVITISLDNETESILRDIAKTKHMKKGSIASVLKTALIEYHEKLRLKEIQTSAIKMLEKGFKLNYKGYKDRGEFFYGRGSN